MKFRVSGFGYKVSDIRFRVSGFGYPVSGIRLRVSCFAAGREGLTFWRAAKSGVGAARERQDLGQAKFGGLILLRGVGIRVRGVGIAFWRAAWVPRDKAAAPTVP